MRVKRIIPCLDVKDGRVVKGIRFVGLRDVGDPPTLARLYEEQGADEVVLLDISASYEGRRTLIDVVKRTAEQLSIPFIVGGGISSIEDVEDVLMAGADKISIGTAAVVKPELVREAARKHGSERVVVAIDAKRVGVSSPLEAGGRTVIEGEGGWYWWEVYTHGGRRPTGMDAVKWAREVEELGAGEILLTSIDYDGTQDGYDTPLTRAVAEAVNIPVIASGGAGSLHHIYEVLTVGRADAALAASIFHFGKYTVLQVKQYLAERGVAVRL
ncbi:MAG: imidazole glycerol phosphate synthase subunit HisF [Candidatus Nezhaarchaeota archaeon]|nr:imidazole glycerol phosphate synthase subunit HisF [Candidatus Nezhaarchaeota archaeon]